MPGGGIDQTASLQEAADKAAQSRTPFFLPPGDYTTTKLELKSGTQIQGVPGKSVLRYNGGAGSSASRTRPTFSGNVIENAPGFGIAIGWVSYLRDVSVTDNLIRNAHIGIRVSTDPSAGTALITDNLITGSNDGAIPRHERPDADRPRSCPRQRRGLPQPRGLLKRRPLADLWHGGEARQRAFQSPAQVQRLRRPARR